MLCSKSAKHNSADVVISHLALPAVSQQRAQLVAVGASTGGTEAYPNRLDGICRIEVRETVEGEKSVPGRAYIAPGNRHTSVHRIGPGYFLEVRDGPLV